MVIALMPSQPSPPPRRSVSPGVSAASSSALWASWRAGRRRSAVTSSSAVIAGDTHRLQLLPQPPLLSQVPRAGSRIDSPSCCRSRTSMSSSLCRCWRARSPSRTRPLSMWFYSAERCQAVACGLQGPQSLGEKVRRQAAPILLPCGQGRGDDGGPLRPRQTVQAASAAFTHPAQPARSNRSRHPPPGAGRDFALPLGRAAQIRSQQQRPRVRKLYSFHPRRYSGPANAKLPRRMSSA